MEVRRLIEERRNTSEGEKQRLKDLSKQIRKCILDKKKEQKVKKQCKEYSKTSKEPGSYPAPNLQKEGYSSRREKWKWRSHSSRQKKGIANVFGEFYSKLYDDDHYDETQMESDKNETENNTE